jgi:hypothetical protein
VSFQRRVGAGFRARKSEWRGEGRGRRDTRDIVVMAEAFVVATGEAFTAAETVAVAEYFAAVETLALAAPTADAVEPAPTAEAVSVVIAEAVVLLQ